MKVAAKLRLRLRRAACAGLSAAWLALAPAGCSAPEGSSPHAALPPSGVRFAALDERLSKAPRRGPEELGLAADVVEALSARIREGRWALWRDGHLVHAEGDTGSASDVGSLAMTLHAALVGVALREGRIESLDDPVTWLVPEVGSRAVTWRHLLSHTSGLHDPDLAPGQRFAWHDANPRELCGALARLWGLPDLDRGFDEVLEAELLGPIGAGDAPVHAADDGVRLSLDLGQLGRLGLLLVTEGVWSDRQLLPAWFVGQIAVKQTRGSQAESPYGLSAWVNSDGDLFPAAARSWSLAYDAAGHVLAWRPDAGVVLAVLGGRFVAAEGAPPGGPIAPRAAVEALDARILGPNPLAARRSKERGSLGSFPRWGSVEIPLEGPMSSSRGEANPFDVLLELTFEGPGGRRAVVPGFYAGDGAGGPDGDVWQALFSPDADGAWSWRSRSSSALLDDLRGSFSAVSPPPSAPDFRRWGRLEAVGTAADGIRYLRFREGPFWLKAGAADPENLLGRLPPYDTPEERRAAIDYLAERGLDSIFLVTHNLGGDGNDVWPWLGSTAPEARRHALGDVRFDVARLAEWRRVFEHMQERGVVPHLVLEDDSAWPGFDRSRYYREMVARFADLPALLFNLAEEYGDKYDLGAALQHLDLLQRIDPYDHPRGIHDVNHPEASHLAAGSVDFASIQTRLEDPLLHHDIALEWLRAARLFGTRVPMIGFDEPRPLRDRRGWWSAFLAGAVWEVHVDAPYDRPLATWEPTWRELGGARAFMETLPFWSMEPAEGVVLAGRAFALSRPGRVYALYLPEGGELVLALPPGPWRAEWWSPENGRDGAFVTGGVHAGGRVVLEAPAAGDWALRLLPAETTDSKPRGNAARSEAKPSERQ